MGASYQIKFQASHTSARTSLLSSSSVSWEENASATLNLVFRRMFHQPAYRTQLLDVRSERWFDSEMCEELAKVCVIAGGS